MATLAVERMASAGAMAMSSPGAHVSLGSSTGAASLSVAGRSQLGLHRRMRSAGSLVAVGMERGRFAGGRVLSEKSFLCRSSISPLSDSNGNVLDFTSEVEFNNLLKGAGDKLVVVDISTRTCGPCKMIFPKLVEMSLAYPDALFLKINGDTNTESRTLMQQWGVRAVPNFRFYKNGQKVHSHTGANVDELKARFAEHYGQPAKV